MVRYTFPKGAHYGIEVSGMERAHIFFETAKAFEKAKIPFNKAIACVHGARIGELYTQQELRDIVKIGADYGIEVIVTPFSRPTYQKTAIQAKSPQGIISGMSWRGQEGVRGYLDDINYLYDIGFRGFLVWRESMFFFLLRSALTGGFPKDIILKISVFAGNANPVDVDFVRWLVRYCSVNDDPILKLTLNPVTDLTVGQIGEIRQVFDDFPLDIHSRIFDEWGGNNRIEEAYEIVNIASPVYFKDEPGEALGIYAPDYPQDKLLKLKLSAVEAARQIIENVNGGNEKYGTDFRILEQGSSDLKLPVVK